MINCPACGLRCVLRIYNDFAECPEHGLIPGLLLMELGRNYDPVDALIEIRASQLRDWVRIRFYELHRWLDNDSAVRITVPYLA